MHGNWRLEKMSILRKCPWKKIIYYLKVKIKLKHPDKSLFISPGYWIQEVVIISHSSETKIIAESIQYPQKVAIQKAAKILRECVRDINSYSTVSWPPKVEELQCDGRKPP